MADSDIVETIKFIGGLAGLGTAAFTIYDRMIKGWPVANLVADKKAGGIAPMINLTIRNPSDHAIMIGDLDTGRDGDVVVGSDESITSVFEADLGLRYVAVIPSSSERMFPLFLVRDDPADLPVTIDVYWRPVTAYFFNRPRVRLRTSTGRLRALQAEAERRWQAANGRRP